MDERSRLSSGARLSISSNRKSQCLKAPTMGKCPFVSTAPPVFLSHGRTVRVQDSPRRLMQSESVSAKHVPCRGGRWRTRAGRSQSSRTQARARLALALALAIPRPARRTSARSARAAIRRRTRRYVRASQRAASSPRRRWVPWRRSRPRRGRLCADGHLSFQELGHGARSLR